MGRENDVSVKSIDAAMGACGWDVEDPIGAAECLLADLRHWCRVRRVSFKDALRASRQMYREDKWNAQSGASPHRESEEA